MGTIDEETARSLIAQKVHEEEVVILDDFIKKNAIRGLGFKGARFPLFDISSTIEICSVTERNSIEGYLIKFRQMFNEKLIRRAAQDFYNLAQFGCPIPLVLLGKGIAEYEKYIREESIFRIPENHYLGIRNVIAEDVIVTPCNYWLEENVTSDNVKAFVCRRIESSGFKKDDELKEEKLLRLFNSLP